MEVSYNGSISTMLPKGKSNSIDIDDLGVPLY
jgi:hypothetical protein